MLRILTVTLALIVAACGGGIVLEGPVTTRPADTTPTTVGDGSPTTTSTVTSTTVPGSTTTTTTTTTPPEPDPSDDTMGVVIYLIGPGGDTAGRTGPFLIPVYREVPETVGVARTALNALLDGPTGAETGVDITSAIPDETVLLDVAVTNGTAIVDLSGEFETGGGSASMFARLAQVVYTVTRFPTVDQVEFWIDGKPVEVFSSEGILLDGAVDRDDYLDLVPTILVESPAHGAPATTPLRVTGVAAVFEATFQMAILDTQGRVLVEPPYVMTDNGTGWGSFDVTLNVPIDEAQWVELRVWNYSAADGSEEAVRSHRVYLDPDS